MEYSGTNTQRAIVAHFPAYTGSAQDKGAFNPDSRPVGDRFHMYWLRLGFGLSTAELTFMVLGGTVDAGGVPFVLRIFIRWLLRQSQNWGYPYRLAFFTFVPLDFGMYFNNDAIKSFDQTILSTKYRDFPLRSISHRGFGLARTKVCGSGKVR